MTSDDSDTRREAEEDPESGAPDDGETGTPPRDPETGQFLPAADSNGPDPDDQQTAASGDRDTKAERRDPQSMSEETDPEPTADEDPSEPSTETEGTEAEPSGTDSDSPAETDATEPDETPHEPAEVQGASLDRDAARPNPPTSTDSPAARPGTDRAFQTVFVPNPNGYPRPATTFLPTHPWLRLPSRPPAHVTISHS
jgi:hypothetical protein